VDREEPLGLCRRFETPHVALAPARRLVGAFGPVVGVAGRLVDDGRHDHPVRGTVAPEAIGDEAAGDTAAPLEQLAKEPRGGVAIPVRLEQNVDDLAVRRPARGTDAGHESSRRVRRDATFSSQVDRRQRRIDWIRRRGRLCDEKIRP
jgi:hypothetical protein